MNVRKTIFKRLEKLEDEITAADDMSKEKLDGFLEGLVCAGHALQGEFPADSVAVDQQALIEVLDVCKSVFASVSKTMGIPEYVTICRQAVKAEKEGT